MRLQCLTFSAAMVLAAVACQSPGNWDQTSDNSLARLVGENRNPPTSLNGIWQSEGYGWILHIEDDSVELLDVTSSACLDARDTLEEYETYFHTYAIDPTNGRLALRGKFEDYTYYFTRLPELPAQCAIEVESTPQTNFDYFVDVMSAHYAFFEVRDIDWDRVADENRPFVSDAMTDDELWALLKSMIEPIDDGHLSLGRRHDGGRQSFMPGRGKTQNSIIPLAASLNTSPGQLFGKWFDEYKTSILSDLLEGEGKIIARDRVIYGMIDDKIGYLNILKMGGYAEGLGWSAEDFQTETDVLNDALDEALTHLASAEAIVVDATYIGGGFDYLGREISARFARQSTLGSHRSPAHTPSVPPQPLYTSPTQKVSFEGPVIILSSNLTMSASESFIMHMKAMPHITHMGEPTRGALSEVLSKTLPNGWTVSISNEDYLDGALRSWEGLGIPPDIHQQVFVPDNIFDGHLDAVWAAANILRQAAR